MRIAVLPLIPSDPNNADALKWSTAIQEQIRRQLWQAPSSIWVVPSATTRYAFHELGLTNFTQNTKAIRKIGRTCEAEIVFWATYEFKRNGWNLKANLIQLPSGKIMHVRTSPATNWLSLCQEAVSGIVKACNIELSDTERVRVLKPITNKPEVFEVVAKAADEIGKVKVPLKVQVERLKEAIAQDPNCSMAYVMLSTINAAQGNSDEALFLIKKAIELDPQNPQYLLWLGTLHASDRLNRLADEEFSQSRKLDPLSWLVYLRQGQLEAGRGNVERAIEFLKEAERVSPHEILVHTELAMLYNHKGQKAKALSELRVAQDLSSLFDEGVLRAGMRIAQVYQALGDLPEAILQYEKFLKASEGWETEDSQSKYCKEAIVDLKQRLTPHPISTDRPRTYSEAQLADLLKLARAGHDVQVEGVPFEADAKLKEWAAQVVQGASTDLEKAERLFKVVATRLGPKWSSSFKLRNAVRVFNAWSDTHTSFSCQELTFLYLAAARSVGLDTFLCDVQKDYLGISRRHACAALFTSATNAILIDFTYRWFGVPHNTYKLLDDAQVYAIYLSETGDLPVRKIATRISPEAAEPWFILALAYGQRDLIEAQNALQRGLSIDSNMWLGFFVRGSLELKQHQWELARKDFETSLEIGPEHHKTYYLLGQINLAQGLAEEAIKAFHKSIELAEGDASFISAAYEAIENAKKRKERFAY